MIGETASRLGQRARATRLDANWKQETLAERAGVSVATVARFEQRGIASFTSVLRIFAALGRLHEIDGLLPPPTARTIDEFIGESTPTRARGRR